MSHTGIHNENEFYSHHYLAEIFAGDIPVANAAWPKWLEVTTPHDDE